MNTNSKSNMGRRRSRGLASAVGDLMQRSESLSPTTADGSYDSTTRGHIGDLCPVLMHRPPYMDVQTVKTSLTADQAAKLEGQSHCLLLVEPVLLPNLGHTGVEREILPGDRPLFYPNGQKKCSMGATVRDALYQSTTIHPTGTVAAAAQQQQGPPSDWAGSSAYYSLPSDNSSSSYNSNPCHYSSNQHSDEVAALAAVPAGQGGRFPTDVWGTPPGEDTGGGHIANNRQRRRRKPAGSSGGFLARQATSESFDSGSIVDRRLARYPGKQEGERGRCSSHETLLAGRKAEVIRAQQWQQQHQHQQELQSTTSKSSRGNINTIEHPPERGEASKTTDAKTLQNSTPTTSTQCSYDNLVASPAHKEGASSTMTLDWTMTDPSTREGGDSVDAAGRDSEWLAERRAADREAKEVLSALKHNSARLCFLVGGG